jgi:hypothetical protein
MHHQLQQNGTNPDKSVKMTTTHSSTNHATSTEHASSTNHTSNNC